MKGLEYEADAFGTHGGTAVLVQLGQVGAVQHDMPAGRQVQPGQQRQQRGLAGARRPDHGNRLTGNNPETDVRKNGQSPFRAANLLADVGGCQHHFLFD